MPGPEAGEAGGVGTPSHYCNIPWPGGGGWAPCFLFSTSHSDPFATRVRSCPARCSLAQGKSPGLHNPPLRPLRPPPPSLGCSHGPFTPSDAHQVRPAFGLGPVCSLSPECSPHMPTGLPSPTGEPGHVLVPKQRQEPRQAQPSAHILLAHVSHTAQPRVRGRGH